MITITSLNPNKNALNVSVNQDVEIRISADFKLDPRDILFKLNNIELVPNAFSIYNGATEYELIITLYTRKRIKYGNNYRYGQDGIRYGMRDVYSSFLEYESRYVCEFTVWGINNSNQKEQLTDSFVFNTETGIYYNQNPVKYFYSDMTQSMANKMPEWSKARYDKYSIFQQLLNPIGEKLEKMQSFVDKAGRSNLIQTLDLNELPFLHKYELSKDFEFKRLSNYDGSDTFVQPEISGIQGVTRFDLFTSEENTLNSLYYNKLPTRINTEQLHIEDNVLVYDTLASDSLIPLDVILKTQGSFALYCKGVETAILKERDGTYIFFKCRIKGISSEDAEQEEEIVLYNESYLYSKKNWKKIESVRFLNLKEQEVTFRILYSKEPGAISLDLKKMVSFNGTTDRMLWSVEDRDFGSILQKRRTIGDTAIDVLKFAGATEVVSEMALYDIDNSTALTITDIAIDPFSDYIYGVDNSFLYVFDKREPYPLNLKKIASTDKDADFALIIDADDLYLDEDGNKEIILKYSHVIPGKKIIKYRLKITQPDSTIKFLLKNGALESNPNNASIFAKQTTFTLDDIVNRFTMTMPGEYIFELETMYQGGTTSTSYGFFYIKKNTALAKYKLDRVLNGSIPVSLFIDTDQKLKMYTNTSVFHTFVFHKDGIIIDYLNKTIYSYEEYSSLDVD